MGTLDNLILLGGAHILRVLKRIEHHHNRQRPHQGLGNFISGGSSWANSQTTPQRPCPCPDQVFARSMFCPAEQSRRFCHYSLVSNNYGSIRAAGTQLVNVGVGVVMQSIK
jgi:hypothetical protein